MLNEIKKSEVKKLFPKRKRDSHKGDNGRVLIVGGSREYYGAPILAGMGALFGGTDLVTLFVPECNFDVSRSYYPDFIVKAFPGDHLDARGVELVARASENQDCVMFGPGIGDREETQTAIQALIKKIECPLVLDSHAIYALPRKETRDNARILITPHAQEFANFCKKPMPSLFIEKTEYVKKCATTFNVNVLLKNPVDIIVSAKGDFCINSTGNQGMTKGGTGDVLAGLIGGLVAQGLSLYNAARIGAFILGTAGDELLLEKGYGYTATDLALHLPYAIQEILK